jgi:hypothetical protein
MAIGDELVELAINQLPHEVLVFFESLRRQQTAQQSSRVCVRRRVHDDQVLVDREHVAVRLDLSGDVVTLGLERQRREGSTDRIDRRERVGVLERRHHLGVAGDCDHAMVRLPNDRALIAQVVEVLVRVLCDGSIREIVD